MNLLDKSTVAYGCPILSNELCRQVFPKRDPSPPLSPLEGFSETMVIIRPDASVYLRNEDILLLTAFALKRLLGDSWGLGLGAVGHVIITLRTSLIRSGQRPYISVCHLSPQLHPYQD